VTAGEQREQGETGEPGLPVELSPTQAATLRTMPKVELHCHLEGTVRPTTFLELAAAHGVPLPTTDPARVYDYTDMATFMVVFERLCAAVVTAEDVVRITQESLVDAAVGSNVVYREMFLNPTLHPRLPVGELLAAVTEGARLAQRDTGIVTRLIPSIFRAHSPEAALAMVEAVVRADLDIVVGLGMDGDERAGAPGAFTEAYALAGAAGLGRTAHAGESFSPQEVRDTLDLLGCTRIDHGYGIVDDPDLLDRVRHAGTHVTYAWLSTTYSYRGPLADHPFRRMHAAGLSMSMGSDDPAMGGTDLASDHVTVASSLGFTAAELAAQSRVALEASWLPEPERPAIRARLAEHPA
jgi:adenosine deaminase